MKDICLNYIHYRKEEKRAPPKKRRREDPHEVKIREV